MKTASFFFALIFALLFFSACTETGLLNQPVAESGQTVKLHLVVEGKNSIVFNKEIETAKGTNAFEAMKANLEVKFTEYEFGPFIEEIEGIKPLENEFWALYVNSEMAPKGINAYSLDTDTDIRWKTEPLSSFLE